MKKLICFLLVVAMLAPAGFAAGSQSVLPVDEDASMFTTGSKDTYILRNEASFREKIGRGVYWVPLNTLGKGEYTDTEILELANSRDPEKIQKAIHTVYDAYHYFFMANTQYQLAMSQNVEKDEEEWEVHQPGRTALLNNKGDCSAFASLFAYLLEDDYDEVGYLTFQSATTPGHVINMIKEGGKYYFIDMTAMTIAMTERVRSFEDAVYIGNLIEATSVDRFIDYWKKEIQPEATLFTTSKGDVVLPTMALVEGEETTFIFGKAEDFKVVRNDDKDHTSVEVTSQDVPDGEWEIPAELTLNRRYVGDTGFKIVSNYQYALYAIDGVRNYSVHLRAGDYHCRLLEMKRTYLDTHGEVVETEQYVGEEIEDLLQNPYCFPGIDGETIWFDQVTDPNIATVEVLFRTIDDNGDEWTEEETIDLTGVSAGYKKDFITEGEHDFQNLKENAEFHIPISKGVEWVPLNVLGIPNSNYRTFDWNKSPEEMKAEIDSLYEAVVAIKRMGIETPEFNQWVELEKQHWHLFGSVEQAMEDRTMHATSLVTLVNYWLEDDYDEVGVVFYAWPNGTMHASNYIREDGQLYYIDLIGYLNDLVCYAPETGNIEDFYRVSYVGNLYKAEDQYCFSDFIQTTSNLRPSIMVQYPHWQVLPIYYEDDVLGKNIVFAVNFENKANPGGPVEIERMYNDMGDGFTFTWDYLNMENPEGWTVYLER